MRTKVIKTGNSHAIIMPAVVLRSQGFNIGDDLEIEEIASGVIVRPVPRRSVMAAAKRVIRDHAELLRELAKR